MEIGMTIVYVETLTILFVHTKRSGYFSISIPFINAQLRQFQIPDLDII